LERFGLKWLVLVFALSVTETLDRLIRNYALFVEILPDSQSFTEQFEICSIKPKTRLTWLSSSKKN
jgi:hypothetical protein